MADYAAKPTKAKEDSAIIELRKRMLGVFLNRCRRMKEVREDGVWWRFLDPNVSWVSSLLSQTLPVPEGSKSDTPTERGLAFPSCIISSEEQPESSASRSSKSYSGSCLATCPFNIS